MSKSNPRSIRPKKSQKNRLSLTKRKQELEEANIAEPHAFANYEKVKRILDIVPKLSEYDIDQAW